MADTKYKIGVEISGDDSKFRASAKSSEKAVSDLEKKASGDLKKIASNFAGIFSSKAKDTGLGQFVGEVTDGTSALDKFLGPATLVSGAIVGIGTAAVASGKMLFDMAKNASDYSGEISDASQKTGLAVDTITSMKFAGEAFGASFEEMTGATTKFTKLVGESAKGNEEAKKTLIALGVDPKKAVTDLDGAMSQAMKTIYNLPPGAQQANAAIAAFGKTGANLIPVINSFEGDLNALKKRASELGLVLTDEAIKAGDDFGDMLAVVTAQLKAQSAAVALEWAPEITRGMDDVSRYLADNQNDWKHWGENIGRMIRGVRATFSSETAGMLKDGANLWFNYSVDPITMLLRGSYKAGQSTGKYLIQQGALTPQNKKDGVFYEGTVSDYVSQEKINPYGKASGKQLAAGLGALEDSENFLGNVADSSKKKTAKKSDLENEIENIKKKYFVGDNRLSIGNGLELRKNLEALAADPKVMLVLSTIKKAEGGAPDVFVGGRKVNDLSRHPGEYIPRSEWFKGPEGKSSASGNYQITLTNYKKLAPMLGISDFSPKSQAILALAVMREQAKAGFVELARGNVEGALRKGTQPWASSSFSTLKGGKKNYIKIAEGLAGTGIESLSGDLGITKKELTEGEKALADINKQIALLGVTTERGRLEVELLSGKYSDLNDVQIEQLRLNADIIDGFEKQAKASDDYSSFLEKINGEYNDLKEIVPTYTEQLDKQFQALSDAGVVLDATGEAYARNIALMLDMQGVSVKLADASEEMTARYKAERDAVWELASAHQELKNSIARETGGREETLGGIVSGAVVPTDDGKAPPKFNNKYKLGDFTDGLLGGNGNNLARFESEAEMMKAVYNDLESTAGAALGSMIEGGAQLLEQWIMTGEISGEAIAQMTASVIAGVASQAAVKSIFEVAEGLAAASNPFTAWQAPGHFAAAKMYGLVALGATAVGAGIGAMGGGLGGKKDKTSNSSSNPSDYFKSNSDDKNINYLRQSSSEKSQNNRENVQQLSMISDAVNGLTNKINSMSPGNVLTAGVKENPGFISDTVDRELAKNSTKATQMGRRILRG